MLTDRVAIVTGASRGIGRAVALELAKRGATVIVNYNSGGDAAGAVVAAIEKRGGKALAVGADVSQFDNAESLITTAVDRFGKVDILVNNAGIIRDNSIMVAQEDDWDAVMNTNLKSAWNCSKAALKTMMHLRYGRIINMTRVVSLIGQEDQSNYAASKAGLIGLTKAMAREVASRQITVNVIAPGFIGTDSDGPIVPEVLKKITGHIPLERQGTAEDVAYAVAFLASDEASYITGQLLSIDGGLIMGG